MTNIVSGYKHYEGLIERIGKERIEQRYQFLHEEMSRFLAAFSHERKGSAEQLYINERVLMHAVLEYFEDIEKVKAAHGLEHTNTPKVMAYMAYWLLLRRPIQLLSSECDDDFVYVNEKFVLSMLLSFLTAGAESKPLEGTDRSIYVAFTNTFYYFLKFRHLDPQGIEMILLAFRLGCVFPECKDVN